MKHAYNFKIQALRNLNLYQELPKPKILEATVESNPLACNLIQGIEKLIKESSLAGGDDPDEEAFKFTAYTQTSFEEDDVTELLQGDEISFYLPETFKERKCASCRRRFMFEDSYNEHIKDCIQLKLAGFIREVAQLLNIKENRCISSHEFIRRVIFSIKKCVQTLVDYDKDKSATEPLVLLPAPPPPPPPSLTVEPKIRRQDIFTQSLSNTSNTSSPLCGIFMRCPECDATFEQLTELETHNFQFHNQAPQSRRKFYSKTSPAKVRFSMRPPPAADTESSAAELNNQYWRRAKTMNIKEAKHFDMIRNVLDASVLDAAQGDAKKSVKCKQCNCQFMTISHLDLHVAKKHSASPKS